MVEGSPPGTVDVAPSFKGDSAFLFFLPFFSFLMSLLVVSLLYEALIDLVKLFMCFHSCPYILHNFSSRWFETRVHHIRGDIKCIVLIKRLHL